MDTRKQARSPLAGTALRHALILGLIASFAAVGVASAASYNTAGLPSFAGLADQVKISVVNVSTTQVIKGRPTSPLFDEDSPFREFFGDEFFKKFFRNDPERERKSHSLGSGVVISSEGIILTNNHVVEKADEIKIKLQNEKEYDAKVVGRDAKTDLALIKITSKPDKDFPKPARLGDSNTVRVGDWVMAVGNPFGLDHTVTVGIISAKGRFIGAGPYDDFLQTDAAINPGNSGGPLFNMEGEIVGINTAIVARGQGIGFAIPINVAKDLMPQLKTGKVVRGWLGVMIQDLSPELQDSFGMKDRKGVLVGDVVKDSPAAEARIERGDIILTVDGQPVETAQDLSRRVAAISPGAKLELKTLRDGKERTVQVAIGTMPDEGTELESEAPTAEKSAWGLTVQNLTAELAQRFGWEQSERCVIITNIDADSPAAEVRLRPGDLIKEVNRRKIQNLSDYNKAIDAAKKTDKLLLLVQRGDHTFYVVVPPSKK